MFDSNEMIVHTIRTLFSIRHVYLYVALLIGDVSSSEAMQFQC